jgi:MYXO-CTERM domain-containing protein
VDLTVSIPPRAGFHQSTKTFTVGATKGRLRVGHRTQNATQQQGFAALNSVSGNGFLDIGVIGHGSKAKRYLAGQTIAGGGFFSSQALLRTRSNGGASGAFGPGSVTGFAGFKNSAGDYGWLHIRVSDVGGSGFPIEAELIDWAYNDVAGTSVKAGDMGVAATPEPGNAALGLLALGAAGVLALRKRCNESA